MRTAFTTASILCLAALTALHPAPALAQARVDGTAPIAPPRTSVTTMVPSGTAMPPPPGTRVNFNMDNVDLADALRAVSILTGRRFIVSTRIRAARFTIYSPTQVTVTEAYGAFLAALATNGMIVVPSGAYDIIEERSSVAGLALPVYRDGDVVPGEPQVITCIHHLRSMRSHEAANLLGHFRSRDADIAVDEETNTLVITDTGINVRRMLDILGEVDVPGRRVTPERSRVQARPAAR